MIKYSQFTIIRNLLVCAKKVNSINTRISFSIRNRLHFDTKNLKMQRSLYLILIKYNYELLLLHSHALVQKNH